MNQAVSDVAYHQYRSGQWTQIKANIISEQPLSLTVNGETWLTFMCTPTYLEALCIGFLNNENIIQSMDEIASIRVCPEGDNVDVWLNHKAERPKNWRRTSGCTGGFSSVELDNYKGPVSNQSTIEPQSVSRLIGKLFDTQDLYREVGGVHSSALCDGEDILITADDIGRHNTLDKIAGLMLLDHLDPSFTILITTGRVSSEMIQKSYHMGASMVISRTSASSLSIKLADRWGITLIGYARRDHFNIYTHSERIVSAPAA
ncbi:MAG: formate dehydrogenase accessory sulfurtransferase FdhD [Omnitrophica WOR_2 bacterium]